MSRNRLCRAEQETIISWDNELDTASIYTYDQRLIHKLERLVKKYPDQFIRKGEEIKHCASFSIPKRCISVRRTAMNENRNRLPTRRRTGCRFRKELRGHESICLG